MTRVEDVTGFPEALDGRVKTLHPAVHAGLLADLGKPAHRARLDELGIAPFQLLVSNLYPFEAAVSSGAPPAECVEQIDIGGPAMVRAAAKNHEHVAVITDPSRYGDVEAAVAAGGFTLEQRRRLAARAYAHTAAYDSAVASWFASGYAPDETAAGDRLAGRDRGACGPGARCSATGRTRTSGPRCTSAPVRRSGPGHGGGAEGSAGEGSAGQSAGAAPAGIAGATQLHGKAMSYNNYVDAAAAWRAAFDFVQPCVAIIKHSNPCGIALGTDLAEAHRKANACDPDSAFGGVIAANGVVTAEMAAQVKDIFTEIVIAPGFEDAALDILSGSKNLRLLTCPPPVRGSHVPEWRQVDGGLLLQTPDQIDAPGDDPAGWELKTGQPASADMLADLAFAWRAIRSVKSNAILLASGLATVGVGMGQVNRVDAARLAVARAGDRAAGSVAASDAYFPFPDGLEVLTAAGIRAVVQPGGSIRDQLSIEAAEQAGITMYLTGVRHFYH